LTTSVRNVRCSTCGLGYKHVFNQISDHWIWLKPGCGHPGYSDMLVVVDGGEPEWRPALPGMKMFSSLDPEGSPELPT